MIFVCQWTKEVKPVCRISTA